MNDDNKVIEIKKVQDKIAELKQTKQQVANQVVQQNPDIRAINLAIGILESLIKEKE